MIRRKWRQFITRLAECSEWLMPRHQRLNVFGPALLSQVLSYRLLNLSCRIMIQCGTSLSLSSCLPRSMLRRRARRDILSGHGRLRSPPKSGHSANIAYKGRYRPIADIDCLPIRVTEIHCMRVSVTAPLQLMACYLCLKRPSFSKVYGAVLRGIEAP